MQTHLRAVIRNCSRHFQKIFVEQAKHVLHSEKPSGSFFALFSSFDITFGAILASMLTSASVMSTRKKSNPLVCGLPFEALRLDFGCRHLVFFFRNTSDHIRHILLTSLVSNL